MNIWDIPIEEHKEAQLAIKKAAKSGGMLPKEVANIMNISLAKVQDIEERALRKLRRNPYAYNILREYIGKTL